MGSTMNENVRSETRGAISWIAKNESERGVALLLALFALFIVTSIALGMMFLSDTETMVNSNFRDEQTAYYAAKAGLEEARDRMRTNAGSGITINASLPTAKPGAAGGALYILNPKGSETVAPWTTTNAYFDDEICKEVSCGGGPGAADVRLVREPGTTASSTYAASPVLPYKWMRITLKTDQSAAGTANVMYVDGTRAQRQHYYVCWNGTNEVTSSTACASPNNPVTPDDAGRDAKRNAANLQYEMTSDTLNLTFPAALTLDGTSDVMSGPDSNPYQMQGADTAGCGATAGGNHVPAIAVNDAADESDCHRRYPLKPPESLHGPRCGAGCGSQQLHDSLRSVSSFNTLLSTMKSNVTNPCSPEIRAVFRLITSVVPPRRR